MSAYDPKSQMFAKVILASRPTNGAPPIITIHTRHPRIIHAEWMTHRVFSRNARSSRAVPVATMLKEIRETPFVPWHWGKNQKGMQAGEEHNAHLDGRMIDMNGNPSREQAWLKARDNAVDFAQEFSDKGYHKQIVNRLLEPFMWIDVLTTSTSWANFFHLRDHKDAEPHFRDLAQMVKEAVNKAEFEELRPGQWHLPYVPHWERADIIKAITGRHWAEKWQPEDYGVMAKISVARCARISYAPFDGDGSIEKELERYELLVGSDPLHASPAEHQATPDDFDAKKDRWVNPELAGNLGPGWIQYRKTLSGEFTPG